MFNKRNALIACACLLVAGTAAAQDYRVNEELGSAFGCSEKKLVQQFVTWAQSDEQSELSRRAVALGLRMGLLAGTCAMYESGVLFEVVAEDRADSEWVLVRRKDQPDSKLRWSWLPWFEPAR